MFFVFGLRVGTHCWRNSLNAHPEVLVPNETDFIIPTAFIFDRLTDPVVRRTVLKTLIVHSTRFPFSLGEFISAAKVEDIVERQSDRADQLFEAIYAALAEHAGTKVAGDKSPNDLIFLRMLIKVGGIAPTAKIIHIVRDVRDVVYSIRNANMTNAPEDWFPRMWSTSNLYLWELFHQSEQYLLVRYEDYVRAPELVLRNLCTHLGIGYQ